MNGKITIDKNNLNLDKIGLNLYDALMQLIDNSNILEFENHYEIKTEKKLPITEIFENLSEGIHQIVESDNYYEIHKNYINENIGFLNKPIMNEYNIYKKNSITNNIEKIKMNENKIDDKNNHKKSKFWDKNDISDVLNEVINPNNIDVSELNVKENLYPNLFDENDKMLPEVRKIILNNVITFLKLGKLDKINYNDIILTGSLANYNWNDYSDVDIHILIDYSQISDNDEFISDFFKLKKDNWNNTIDATIDNHEIEMYIQDINEPHASSGVYSIIKNEWLLKPIKQMISLDINNIKSKADYFIDMINDFLENGESIKIDNILNLLDKLKKYRKIGLNKEGEFSTENIVYKILRNYGYIGDLIKLKNQLISKKLTLENKMGKNYIINENQLKELVKRKKIEKKKNSNIIIEDDNKQLEPKKVINK